ncbi:hypothetical protein GLOTRDRAFT_49432 [Gloeophyllum trabeum ATCC 11539]|uniref:Uncharacterized protein n=1 Tax=Gloeophyllum trabeum (strain ATCC 11539 / FP-39264 / Madison 617) TaxID=670483 RepID=S7PT22_GLOTA|nr:uncharacterized protein GLOTRDRAFT_49432 [Gloeophyllum trabeum ATCC 11539]EPQ50966.1 hypothetical protein GLOTRDRAFT_49432 [Gloeophyllum trabeum ATCC 11539]
MHPSARRLVRIIPRSRLPTVDPNTPWKSKVEIIPSLPPTTKAEDKPTLMDALQRRKEQAGARYPSNIRLEPLVNKRVFKPVAKEHRAVVKDMLKER